MEKDFAPYPESMELKKLGFDEPCFGCYDEKGVFGLTVMSIKQYYTNSKEDTWNCAAPTYQQAFRWFREKYVLLGFIEPANGYEDKSLFAFYICDDEQNIINDEHSYSKDSSLHFKTYEDAELACLRKLIEIAKLK